MMKIEELRSAYNAAAERVETAGKAIDELDERSDVTPEEYDAANEEIRTAAEAAEAAKQTLEQREAVERARATYKPSPESNNTSKGSVSLTVDEPDMYTRGGKHSFFTDMYWAKQDAHAHPDSAKRIADHQRFEIEKRAVSTGTMGGLIPPAYLIGLYAKAGRNGRVYADQVNHQTLPDVGMSVIIPRLTQGLAAGVQTSESSTVSTQDPTETDLTVNVRTIAGYSPVSRQTLERAAYNDQVLMEDLIARYNAALDTQCISGSGSSGQMLGVLNTSSISTSAASTMTVAGVWPKIADVTQQINTATGGLGYVADKIVMHPRRWGFFTAAFDSSNRPVFGITGESYFNNAGNGDPSEYGPVGHLMGLPVFTDANIPTNLGSGTNEDRIIVFASGVSHLWERSGDPVTLSFEQQAGTSLQIQLVCYGYAAFTAGRYPAASGVVTGLTTPSF